VEKVVCVQQFLQWPMGSPNVFKTGGRAANHWKAAMNQFAILYEERFTQRS
jgi:hypothetical protein